MERLHKGIAVPLDRRLVFRIAFGLSGGYLAHVIRCAVGGDPFDGLIGRWQGIQEIDADGITSENRDLSRLLHRSAVFPPAGRMS